MPTIAIITSQFNDKHTHGLRDGAVALLREEGLSDDQIVLHEVPGAFELPLAAQWLADTAEYEAVICIGAVIKGDTPHFDFVAAEAARGIMTVGLETGIPIIFGVITTNDEKQATERSAPGANNRGAESAKTALAMVRLGQEVGVVEEFFDEDAE